MKKDEDFNDSNNCDSEEEPVRYVNDAGVETRVWTAMEIANSFNNRKNESQLPELFVHLDDFRRVDSVVVKGVFLIARQSETINKLVIHLDNLSVMVEELKSKIEQMRVK